MTNHALNIAVATGLLFSTPAFAEENVRTTEEVLNNHLAAFGSRDLEAAMEDYTKDSAIVLQTGILEGEDQIRGLLVALFDEFSKPGMSFELDTVRIYGDVAYIVWHAETADNIYEYATDTFVIEDGKIRTQTAALAVTPK